MKHELKLTDWVQILEQGYPAGYGTNMRVDLRHLVTGESRTDIISQERWIDEDYYFGYGALCAGQGFEIILAAVAT